MLGPIIFNSVVILAFLIYFFYSKEKAILALKNGWLTCKLIFPLIVLVLTLLLFLQRMISETVVIDFITRANTVSGYVGAVILGSVIHVPLFITFPIGGELLHSGVNPGHIAVLITSLVMVSFFTLPIEIKELGVSFALKRNLLSFVAAILIGIIVGLLY